jgi:glucosamine--fructose-6-phosphate aminotransferase (isomerizing)
MGIAHTRWATHGNKTQVNSHPHMDSSGRIYIVHNGIIDNYAEIKTFLQQQGFVFRSETDTEVIAHLIAFHLREGIQTKQAVEKTLKQLKGTWGLLVLDTQFPPTLIATRKGSPIVIGLGEEEVFIASETDAFMGRVSKVFSLHDDEILEISPGKMKVHISRVESISCEPIPISPAPYKHWTEKEILQQPQTIQSALNNGGRILNPSQVKLGGLNGSANRFRSAKHLLLTGCGTSFYACLYAKKFFQATGVFDTVRCLDASEITLYDLSTPQTAIGLVSQSGETKDLLNVLDLLESTSTESCLTFGVVNRVGSFLSKRVSCGVYLNAGREVSVASTKAFTSQVVVLSLIACWFAQERGMSQGWREKIIESLSHLSPYTSALFESPAIREQCQTLAQVLTTKEHCFILGKGQGEAIAKEAALKIKEITYLHAEGFAGGALKHGPFALIEKGTPIILLVPDGPERHFMTTTIHEVKARGAYTIVLSTIEHQYMEIENSAIDVFIRIPDNHSLSQLMFIFPLQLLAYYMALEKGINPDRPRNLAKTVTVK